VLNGPWTRDDLLAALDSWSAEIEGAAKRDEVKWSEAYHAYWVQQRKDFNRNTYLEEIEYLRQWIRTRWAFIAANL
jgi:hypothetical protein